jgi:hypothetical protein
MELGLSPAITAGFIFQVSCQNELFLLILKLMRGRFSEELNSSMSTLTTEATENFIKVLKSVGFLADINFVYMYSHSCF